MLRQDNKDLAGAAGPREGAGEITPEGRRVRLVELSIGHVAEAVAHQHDATLLEETPAGLSHIVSAETVDFVPAPIETVELDSRRMAAQQYAANIAIQHPGAN